MQTLDKSLCKATHPCVDKNPKKNKTSRGDVTLIKIYLSNFEVSNDFKRHKDFELKVPKLLDDLKKYEIEIVYLKEFEEYDIIEKTIAQCDCLLAIVDEYWTSSTWKASEVTYANGDGGSGITNNPRITPKPVFIFPVYENVKLAFLKDYKGPIMLSSNVNEAVMTIVERLFKGRTSVCVSE